MLEGIEAADADDAVFGEVPQRIEPAGLGDRGHLFAEIVVVLPGHVLQGLDLDLLAEHVDLVPVGTLLQHDVEFIVEADFVVVVQDGEGEVAHADERLDDAVEEGLVVEDVVVVDEIVAAALDVAPVHVQLQVFGVVDQGVEDVLGGVHAAVVLVVHDQVAGGGLGAVVVEREPAVGDGEEELAAFVQALAHGLEEADEVRDVLDHVVRDEVVELIVAEDGGEGAGLRHEVDVDERLAGVELLEVLDQGVLGEDVVILDVGFLLGEQGRAEGADLEAGEVRVVRDVLLENLPADVEPELVFLLRGHLGDLPDLGLLREALAE